MAKHPAHKRTKAQAAAAVKFAAAGRASQAKKRAAEKAKGLPTRTAKQTQSTAKFAAAGRAAQARKRAGLKPLPKATRALAGDQAVRRMGREAVSRLGPVACLPVNPYMILAETNWTQGCCAATAIAYHLYAHTGIMASQGDVRELHDAVADPSGARIPELLEAACDGFAGVRLARFWPLDTPLPGSIAGLTVPAGSHAVLLLSGAACVSWGRVRPCAAAEEAWWAEWECQ